MHFSRPSWLIPFVLIPLSCNRTPSPEDQVATFTQAFVEDSLALSPSGATAQGYHDYHGVLLDNQLDDVSPFALDRVRGFFQKSLEEVNRLKAFGLKAESKADVDVIQLQCRSALLDFDKIQSYKHNPTVYVETIGNAIYSPFILNYAPEEQRFEHITSRIEKIPAFLAAAKQNLISAPEIWSGVAREEDAGNIDLVDHTLRARVPPPLKERYDRAAANALAAFQSFDAYLATDLAERSYDWRLGAGPYGEKFAYTLATGATVEKTLEDAQTKLASIREDMRKQAAALFPKFFPGQTPPADLNALVSQVLDKVAQQHAKPNEYFDSAKRDLAETTQFVQDHHLLQLPKVSSLQVIPTPEFMRGIYGVGGFSPAPALAPSLGAYYWITPFTPDMTPARIESKLREYNVYGLKILTIHEAMPGHYVQFEYANQVGPKWRGALRAIYSNGPYVEGWAVYATEMMIDAGYDKTPEMQLTFGKQMLRVVSNTILDIKLQTMGMTDQEAVDLMINDTFQEREEAEKKLQRAKLSSCQLPTYFVGWRGWDRLRDAYRSKHAANFKLSDFNERSLQEGGIPLPVLSGILQ